MCRLFRGTVLAESAFLIVTIVATLVYAFLNGMTDSGGLVAASISSGSLTPRVALTLASVAEFSGPFLFGTAVAATIGKGLVQPDALGVSTLFIAVVSATIWNVAANRWGIPSSSTHGLLGGLIGAAALAHGWDVLLLGGFARVLLALLAAPVLGFAVGFGLERLVLLLTRRATPRINGLFKRLQVLSVLALALSHGTNDGQKSMGLISLALVASHRQAEFAVPLWATLLCALALTLGVRMGGWRIIRTMGSGIYRLRPSHAFSAQVASTGIVLGAALLGNPVSCTQVVSTAIIGVGSAQRVNAVHWLVARRILTAWIITIPASALIALVICYIFIKNGI